MRRRAVGGVPIWKMVNSARSRESERSGPDGDVDIERFGIFPVGVWIKQVSRMHV